MYYLPIRFGVNSETPNTSTIQEQMTGNRKSFIVVNRRIRKILKILIFDDT